MSSSPPEVGQPWPRTEPLPGTGVLLTRPGPEDRDDLLALNADPALWVDVPDEWRVTTPQQQTADLATWTAHWSEHGFGYWVLREAGVVRGVGGVRWLWWREAWALNVYVRLAAAVQGRGLARRMLALAIDRLDERLAEPVTVVVRTRPGNDRMAALAGRLGLVDDGFEDREAGSYRLLARRVGVTGAA